MKKPFLFFALACVSLFAVAQDKNTDQKEDKKEEGFVFTTVKENPITSIKNQNQSGTCWCFSSLSFFESELIRLGKGEQDLCEMFCRTQNHGRPCQTNCPHSRRRFLLTGRKLL